MSAQVVELRTDYEAYITLDEVARRLGYSERWVHRRIKDDGLPTHQRSKGSPHRFRWTEVERWFTAWNE